MILQALCEYYDRMVRENPTEIAEPGYAVTPVSKCIVIDQEGNLMQVIDRMEEREITVKKGKKKLNFFHSELSRHNSRNEAAAGRNLLFYARMPILFLGYIAIRQERSIVLKLAELCTRRF